MTAAQEQETLAVLRVLSDPTRLRLLRLLGAQREGQALCVHALAGRLGVSGPAVSQHLGLLKALGLVHARQDGVRTHYYLNRQRLAECRALVTNLLDPGDEHAAGPAYLQGL